MADATKTIKVPVHYTTVFKNQYRRDSRGNQIAAGFRSRLIPFAAASVVVGFAIMIWAAVIIGALLRN